MTNDIKIILLVIAVTFVLMVLAGGLGSHYP